MTTSSHVAVQAILSALNPAQSAENYKKETAHLNWDDVAIRAIVLGLAPQLYHRISAWQMDS